MKRKVDITLHARRQKFRHHQQYTMSGEISYMKREETDEEMGHYTAPPKAASA